MYVCMYVSIQTIKLILIHSRAHHLTSQYARKQHHRTLSLPLVIESHSPLFILQLYSRNHEPLILWKT